MKRLMLPMQPAKGFTMTASTTSSTGAELEQRVNFGGNQRWYARVLRPTSEAELLDILARHGGSTVKALGAGHSWSGIGADSDIAIDMSALAGVEALTADASMVRVGAGCRLQDLLDRLHAMSDRTLPTLGAIKKQTISGAIATGTHGSGRPSLSHFVVRLRAAVFDPDTGAPVIREFAEGPELLAARCGLGCLGIVVSVDLPTVPKYLVAETTRKCSSLADAQALFADNPLTNFLWLPYTWTVTAFERRVAPERSQSPGQRLKALFFRLFTFVMLDVVFHLLVITVRKFGRAAIELLFRIVPNTMPTNRTRVDESTQVLTFNHDLFRHEEMELFVAERHLGRAAEFLQAAVEAFSQPGSPALATLRSQVAEAGLSDAADGLAGSYVHHYPLFFRRVPPEETMVSMGASIDEPVYSISIFTYDPPGRRASYYTFCSLVARVLLKQVGARLHWGKHFPLEYADIAPLYPRLDEFRALCRRYDRAGTFRNGYTFRVLGLGR